MSTFVALAVLASAVVHALWNALLKRRGDPLVASTGLSITWACVFLPLCAFLGPPPADAWPALAASVVVHLAYFSLLVAAYRVADLSLVYPIARGLPPLGVALTAALFLGERPGWVALGGIALVVVGVLMLRPRGEVDDHARNKARRATAMALGVAALITVYTTIDGWGSRLARDPWLYMSWLSGVQGALFALGSLALGGRSLANQVRAAIPSSIAAGLLSALGYGVALWAMSQAEVALVAALRETGVVCGALFGTFWLGEGDRRRRLSAALVVAAGAVLVRFG